MELKSMNLMKQLANSNTKCLNVCKCVCVFVCVFNNWLTSCYSYRRKLKAAKAMKSATMMVSENQKNNAVVPGTNKYTMEGSGDTH